MTERHEYDLRYRTKHRDRVHASYKAWRKRNLERARETARIYALENRKRHKAYREANPDIFKRATKKWVAKNQHKRKAYKAIQLALKSGKLLRPDHCQNCGLIGKPFAHHHRGYEPEFRLDVKWLCRMCHFFLHRKVVTI